MGGTVKQTPKHNHNSHNIKLLHQRELCLLLTCHSFLNTLEHSHAKSQICIAESLIYAAEHKINTAEPQIYVAEHKISIAEPQICPAESQIYAAQHKINHPFRFSKSPNHYSIGYNEI